MANEEKSLLLKDLCARLPYKVKFLRESWNYEWDQEISVIEVLEDIDKDGYINNTKVYSVKDIKPYLRPMSSMTEVEKEIYKSLKEDIDEDYCEITQLPLIDWLNAEHFDYRGLIERGLALEALEGMYKS